MGGAQALSCLTGSRAYEVGSARCGLGTGSGPRRKVWVLALVPSPWVSGKTQLVACPCGDQREAVMTAVVSPCEARTGHSGPWLQSRPSCLLVLSMRQGQASLCMFSGQS